MYCAIEQYLIFTGGYLNTFSVLSSPQYLNINYKSSHVCHKVVEDVYLTKLVSYTKKCCICTKTDYINQCLCDKNTFVGGREKHGKMY
jgi:hypothetical protein